MSEDAPQFIEVGTGAAARRIALLETPPSPQACSFFWLSGFKSDMASTKASALDAWAREHRYGCTRFDYSGHGVSDGRFENGTIGRWLEEAVAVFRQRTRGPQIAVGSSMGGYLALLMLQRLLAEAPEDAQRLSALMLIAPAWDMTEALMWRQFPEEVRQQLAETGVFLRPSLYGDPYPITRALIEDGRRHLIETSPFDPGRPVHVLHGKRDPDVPWQHTERLMAFMPGDRIRVTWVEDGEHRLSRPEDLATMFDILTRLAAETGRG